MWTWEYKNFNISIVNQWMNGEVYLFAPLLLMWDKNYDDLYIYCIILGFGIGIGVDL